MLSNEQFPWKFFLKKPQDSDINEYGTTFNSYAQIFKMQDINKDHGIFQKDVSENI